MVDLNLPKSMSPEDREAFEEIFRSASGTPKRAFDPAALSDSVTDIMAGLGSQAARSKQLSRRIEKSMAEDAKSKARS